MKVSMSTSSALLPALKHRLSILVYIGNERISMTLHEQSNKALEALEVWQPSPFKNVE